MSYSRWICSNWYVFWHASSDKTKEGQLLAIWHAEDTKLPHFTYGTLKKHCSIEGLKKLLGLDLPEYEYQELLGYVKQFLEDVENEFKNKEENNE